MPFNTTLKTQEIVYKNIDFQEEKLRKTYLKVNRMLKGIKEEGVNTTGNSDKITTVARPIKEVRWLKQSEVI